MKEKIIELLESYSQNISVVMSGVPEVDFETLAEELVQLIQKEGNDG